MNTHTFSTNHAASDSCMQHQKYTSLIALKQLWKGVREREGDRETTVGRTDVCTGLQWMGFYLQASDVWWTYELNILISYLQDSPAKNASLYGTACVYVDTWINNSNAWFTIRILREFRCFPYTSVIECECVSTRANLCSHCTTHNRS